MRTTVAGIEIFIPPTLWFLDTNRRRPVYHRSSGRADGLTACGRPLFTDGRVTATFLPARHGVRIGRPCCHCWPEIRRVTTLKGVLA
jgi:hypothetical protein